MLTLMDAETVQQTAVLALHYEVGKLSLSSLGDMARDLAAIDARIDPIEISSIVASEIESIAREVIPHLPHLDLALLVDGCTMRDLYALQRGDVDLIGLELGAQLRAVYEIEYDPHISDWIGAMDLAKLYADNLEMLSWLGGAKIGDSILNTIKRIA